MSLLENRLKSKSAANEFGQTVKGVSLMMDAWRRLRRNRMAMTGMIIIIFYALICFAAPLLPFYSYRQQVLEHQFLPPSLKPVKETLYQKRLAQLNREASREGRSLNAEDQRALEAYREQLETQTFRLLSGEEILVNNQVYLLGTDALGRDVFSRIIYGGQVSILIGLIGALTSVFIGVVMGSLAGYIGGRFDSLIMRTVDIIYSLPYMLLVIIFMSMSATNKIGNLFFALAIVSWLTVCRVVRGQIISLKNSEFIEAAKTSGAGTLGLVFRHLIPNTSGIIVVYTTLRIPTFIMLEAFLSYLGLGVQPPLASWGVLIHDGVTAMETFPWLLLAPAAAMSIFMFSMNFFGDGLRDALDPQSKNKL
ncbi:MAG: ABC transporter permease [Spirochaetales bacterium]|jgi:oligopeptide transport system permease protein|nr:ABC transporter permease [Spirochaetales bacterium]